MNFSYMLAITSHNAFDTPMSAIGCWKIKFVTAYPGLIIRFKVRLGVSIANMKIGHLNRCAMAIARGRTNPMLAKT